MDLPTNEDGIEDIKQLCKNHLVVWAAGNDGYHLHSSLERALEEDENVRKHLFVVSNVKSDGKSLNSSSNYFGLHEQKENPLVQAVGIAAPGTDIVSTIAEKEVKQFGIMSGTSQAAPLVSGLLARLISDYPNASITEIADRVRKGANQQVPFNDPEKFGQGMIDVQNTYRLAKAYFK